MTRLLLKIVCIFQLLSLAAAQTVVHLSNTASDAGDLFRVRVERLDDVTSSDGELSVQKTTSLIYEYDIGIAENEFTSANAPVRLDPISTGQISSYSVRDEIARSVALDDVVGDIALGVAPLAEGAKRVTIAMVVSAVDGGRILKQDVLKANVEVSKGGKIVHVDSTDSSVLYVDIESFPVDLTAEEAACASGNQYWCRLMDAARSAKSAISDSAGKILNSKTSDADNKHRTTETDEKKLKSGCKDSHSKHKHKHKYHHHRHHRGGRNESATSMMNSIANSFFTIAFPLLIGILSGSVVVLIAIGIADFYANYCLAPAHGYQTVIVTDSAISAKELAEFIEQRRSLQRDTDTNSVADEKLSFDSDYGSAESHPLMKQSRE
ncbi:hypothetical protein POJ06DRAFT_36142 [Lipomyces tetrasporus]|uniref:Uncharacterized protein n=1 Tax=Lipomyces tetrasporus TaxID=54092 RepID=A0AAD7QLP8_9ASCO|nr:uncharacterized protein POJ06DRAFT_36142 [Lipomyces tetrasporus]KAJ8097640.1 hypothetical protein POJ06DRAFT_36142 [Lipomyces tetrasporus]